MEGVLRYRNSECAPTPRLHCGECSVSPFPRCIGLGLCSTAPSFAGKRPDHQGGSVPPVRAHRAPVRNIPACGRTPHSPGSTDSRFPLTVMPKGACSKTSRNSSSLSRSFRSARKRLPMSRAMPAAPTTSPAGFRIGEIESETSIPLPSLPWRTVSKRGRRCHHCRPPSGSAALRRSGLRGENGDIFADNFLARITEQHFRSPVPTDDGSVQGYGVNRIVGRFYD